MLLNAQNKTKTGPMDGPAHAPFFKRLRKSGDTTWCLNVTVKKLRAGHLFSQHVVKNAKFLQLQDKPRRAALHTLHKAAAASKVLPISSNY